MFSIYLLDNPQLYQWDLNRKIKIIGKEENIDEIHICHIGDEEALVVPIKKEKNILIADIPNILLQTSEEIMIYLVKNNKTIKEFFFKVNNRERPSAYIYEETEVLNYSLLNKRLNQLEEDLDNIEEASSDKISSPLIASIGQILEVEEIDNDGKPIKWKAVNKPTQLQADVRQSDKQSLDYVKNQLVYDFVMNTAYGDSEYFQCNSVETPEYGITVIKDLSFVPSSVLTYYTYEYNCDITKSPYMKISWDTKYGTQSHGFSEASSVREKIDTINSKITINATQGLYIYLITDVNVLTDEYKELFNNAGVYLQAINESYVGDAAKTYNIRVEFHKTKKLTKRYLDNSILYTEDKDEILEEVNTKITSPTTSEVGQILSVKAVDENNKPIKWETIDAPTGSGEDGYSPIATVEQTDTGATISIKDKNGTTTATVNNGEDGKDGKTPYIDEEGFVVCGENNEYPKKVFEYEWKNNYDKINITAIDYETGILTVDSMPSQITDDVDTTVRVFVTTLIDGVEKKFSYGNIPQEFYTNDFFYGVKVGENQLQLYAQNSTVISALTDSENIDLTRLQLFIEKSRNKSIASARINSLEQSHRYKAIYHIPKGAHQVAGISIYKLALPNSGAISYGDGYGEGYISGVADFYEENNMYIFSLNTYETVSMRGVRYSLNQILYTRFPRIFTIDVYPMNDKVSKADVTVGYFYPKDKTPTATSKITYHDLKSAIYLQTPFVSIGCTSGNGNFILDGTRFEVWDYGEVF